MNAPESTATVTPPAVSRPARPRAGLPGWVGGGIVLLCVAGVGWLGWTSWNAGTPRTTGEVLPRDPKDSVKRTGSSRWQVVGGLGVVTITRKGLDAAADLAVEFDWPGSEYVTGDTARVLKAVKDIVDFGPADWATKLGLSADQLAALRAVRERRAAEMRLDPADERRLKSLFAAYEPLERAAEKATAAAAKAGAKAVKAGAGAPKAAPSPPPPETPEEAARREAEAELCDAVEAIVRQRLPSMRRMAADRAAAAKAVLTPEQWKSYEAVSGRRP